MTAEIPYELTDPNAERALFPQRVQLRRTKGWRKPANTIVVARPGPFGNPFPWQGHGQTRENAVACFRDWIGRDEVPAWAWAEEHAQIRALLPGLRGMNLACWCPLDTPCHADVLIEVANG